MNSTLRRLVLIVAIGLCAALTSGLLFHTDHVFLLVAMFWVVRLLLLSLLLAALGVAIQRAWQQTVEYLRPVCNFLFALSLVLLLQFAAIPVASCLHNQDIHNAKEFCEALVPMLDEVKTRTGSYPTRIDDLLPPGKPLPVLLRSGGFYTSQKPDHFFFSISTGWFQSIELHSTGRTWVNGPEF